MWFSVAGEQANERRRAPRHEVSLPVSFDEGGGVARNVSIHGVYFETQEPVSSGTEIEFDLRADGTEEHVPDWFACRGDVVRVENRDRRFGVAVRLTSVRYRGERPDGSA